MEQILGTKLSQKLAMNAKLQQAVHILGLSAQELREIVEKEYLENPALEMDDVSAEEDGAGFDAEKTAELSVLSEDPDSEEFAQGYASEDRAHTFEAASPMTLTLEEELLAQAKFAFPKEKELEIAAFLIGSLNANGYLTISAGDTAEILQAPPAQVEKVLRRIQEFEPIGVGARSLRECLRIQAKRQGIYDGLLASIIENHLDKVAAAKIRQIAASENCSPEDVRLAVRLLRTLDPKPGSSYGEGSPEYIVPDVRIQKENGEYTVHWLNDQLPRLRISGACKAAARTGDTETRNYIRKRLDSALWLLRSIEKRRETILRVVNEIVRQQKDFLDKGEQYLKPMTMSMTADSIGVHESTVSRAVANKYAQLPRGIFPLRKFFTAHTAGSSSDEGISSTGIKAVMKKLLDTEDPQHPLSDQKLTELLNEQGMSVSRRTVMKYREQMGYASSVKRKR